MKSIIAAALAASVVFTGAAHAMTGPTLSSDARFFISDDVNLTLKQINAINAAVHSDESRNDVSNAIRSILNKS